MIARTRWLVPRQRQATRLLAATLAAVLVLLMASAGAAAHGPDPIFSGRWNQNQALRSRGDPDPCHRHRIPGPRSRRLPPTHRQSRFAGRHVRLQRRRGEPRRLRDRGDLQHARASPASPGTRPTSFTIWMREQGHRFDWGTLRWCQAYAIVAGRMLRRREHHPRRVRARGDPQAPRHVLTNESDYLDALVQTVSHAKPKTGWNAHCLRTLRRRQPAAPVRHAELGRQVLDLPQPGHDADPVGESERRCPRAAPPR